MFSFLREKVPQKNVMEAMGAGKPVIGTNVRGTRDLIRHNENGLLVDLGNSLQLVNEPQMLPKSKDLREAYGKRGKQMIEEFSTEKVVEEMQNIYFAVP